MFFNMQYKYNVKFVIMALLLIMASSYMGTREALMTYKIHNLSMAAHERMAKAPQPLPDEIPLPEDWKYARVSLAGSFDFEHEFLVAGRYRNGKIGYNVITPFKRASGSIVFANRGWVSDDTISKITRPQGIIKIEAIVTMPRIDSKLARKTDPNHNLWYHDDIVNMAKKADIKTYLPVIVNSLENNEYPAGGKIRLEYPPANPTKAGLWYLFSFAVLLLLL